MVSKLAARDIVAAVATAARRWSEGDYGPRIAAARAVGERTGYPANVVETAFDRLFMPLTAAAIEATIVAELGSLDVLDTFVTRDRIGRVRAFPIGRVCIISSRTTIGVALLPAIFALCAGCEVLVKDREDHLIAAFFETLSDVQPLLAHRVRATTWKGNDDAVDLGTFNCVVAFGSDDTLSTIARGLPVKIRFIPYGTAASAGYVDAGALDDEARTQAIADDAASDALLYDGEGCMSLHVLFVESGGRISPAAFTERLRAAFAQTALAFPASPVPASTAHRALERDAALLRSAQRIFSDERASYLLVEGTSNGSSPLFMPRATNVVVVDNLQQAAAYLQRHGITLEALAVSGEGRNYFELARACKAARITSFGGMQAPPPGSPHGGRPCIAEFIRWMTDET